MAHLFDITPEFKQALQHVWSAIGSDMMQNDPDEINSNLDVVDVCINSGCFEVYGGPQSNEHMLELHRLIAAYGYPETMQCIADQIQLW